MTIQSKLSTFTIIDETYVNAATINDLYKTIYRKSGSTQKKLISDLKLERYVVLWRRHKDKTKVGSIATRLLDQFKSQTQDLYLEIKELETPQEGPNKKIHIELLRLINDLPDLANDSESDNEPEKPTIVASAAPIIAPSANQLLMPIIVLEEHEMFRDANDQVFPIEVRGERTKDKILFKAKDIESFIDKNRLIENMFDSRGAYKCGSDYIILQENMIPELTGSRSSEELSIDDKRINHNLVYLTLPGLIRVASVSRNANANLLKLFDWLVHLFYVHQFGSYEERNELAQSLFKQVLNDKLAGLYCIDLGTFNDLYDSMNISRVTYPPEIYGNYRVCKFGLSENISTRLTQHKNKKTGYGQWSSDVQFKWLILLSPSQLPKAEKILSNLLKADGYTFDHSDTSKNHTELIMFDPLKEHKVKQIYRQVLDLYPSKENELSKALEDAQSSFETKINLIQATADNAIMKAHHETQLIKTELTIQSLSHKNEMLEMQLKLAHVGII